MVLKVRTRCLACGEWTVKEDSYCFRPSCKRESNAVRHYRLGPVIELVFGITKYRRVYLNCPYCKPISIKMYSPVRKKQIERELWDHIENCSSKSRIEVDYER